jgi:hypothetical protein
MAAIGKHIPMYRTRCLLLCHTSKFGEIDLTFRRTSSTFELPVDCPLSSAFVNAPWSGLVAGLVDRAQTVARNALSGGYLIDCARLPSCLRIILQMP